MPIYNYECFECRIRADMVVPIKERDNQLCGNCDMPLHRHVAAPLGRMAGQVVQGGGPDRHTADCLGIPVKELPTGLRHDFDTKTGKLRAPR